MSWWRWRWEGWRERRPGGRGAAEPAAGEAATREPGGGGGMVRGRHPTRRLALLFALTVLIINLMPFAFLLVSSLKAPGELEEPNPQFLPRRWTTEHYGNLLATFDLARYFGNSLLYAGGVATLSLLINGLAAYAFACLRFPGRERLFALLLLTMMVPTQVTILPTFLLLRHAGLLNTMPGLILPGIATGFGVFMLRGFMRELPLELLEQARIDGCGDWDIFWRIVLPLSRPIVWSMFVFAFIGAWNDFLGPLVFMLTESGQPMPVALANLTRTPGAGWGMLMAGATLTIVPGIILFMLAQRHYLDGITAGAVR